MNNRLWINLAAIVCLLIGINLKGETIQITDADISRNTTWTANNQYVLNGLVFVEEGETLTIEPGTVIKGKPGQGAEASALVVAREGKIFAEGTAEAPIIFTAEADDASDPEDFGSTDRGLWGGVIVLGRATLNSPSDSGSPITDNIEGIDINETRGRFGGNDDTDNSGVLRYISIRHGGTLIGADNEINGLTLGAVGSGTTLEFIEVFANLDDGIEFFGGTLRSSLLRSPTVGMTALTMIRDGAVKVSSGSPSRMATPGTEENTMATSTTTPDCPLPNRPSTTPPSSEAG